MEIQLNKERIIKINSIKYSKYNKYHNYIQVIKNNQWDHPVLPSEIRDDGCMVWRKNNETHRKVKPAVIHPDGEKYYYEDGTFIK